jgi:diaminopimelate decarboxylase
VKTVLAEGLLPEVGTLYEWTLARRLGHPSRNIVVNGPNKGALLRAAVTEEAGLIVVDGFEELAELERLAKETGRRPRILLRVNPDYVPRGMNQATATGSRKSGVFGFDLASGEVDRALTRLAQTSGVSFQGFHGHIGTGIRSADDYREPVRRLARCVKTARRLGLSVEILDIGGGFGVATSREFNTGEFLLYQAAGRLPRPPRPERFPSAAAFAAGIAAAIGALCAETGLPLPRLVVEPGRAVASGAGVLLVTVGAIKSRPKVNTWVITDGGAGTVAFPLFYEYHEVFLCRAPDAKRTERYTLVGSVCFSADWIYRNKPMPPVAAGDVLAVCDAGAYFTVQECNFGFPRPAIVAVRDGRDRLLRRRESFDDMVTRDLGWEDESASVESPARARVRLLKRADLPRAASLASAAFRENRFYQTALGLDPAAFDAYWREFLPLALRDPSARVYGIEASGALAGILVASAPEFPRLRLGLAFLFRLARRIGGRRLGAYLRFVRAYERVMRRPPDERHREARGLWLLVAPGHGAGLGTRLVRRVVRIYEAEGRTLATALADAGNPRLLEFYRRLGFTVRARVGLAGGEAVVFERDGSPPAIDGRPRNGGSLRDDGRPRNGGGPRS